MKLNRRQQLIQAFSLEGGSAPITKKGDILTEDVFDDSSKRCGICNTKKVYSDFRLKKDSDVERMDVCACCSRLKKSKPDSLNSPHKINREEIKDNLLYY